MNITCLFRTWPYSCIWLRNNNNNKNNTMKNRNYKICKTKEVIMGILKIYWFLLWYLRRLSNLFIVLEFDKSQFNVEDVIESKSHRSTKNSPFLSILLRYFKWQTKETAFEFLWKWLRRGDLNKETESWWITVQNDGKRINYVKARIDNEMNNNDKANVLVVRYQRSRVI